MAFSTLLIALWGGWPVACAGLAGAALPHLGLRLMDRWRRLHFPILFLLVFCFGMILGLSSQILIPLLPLPQLEARLALVALMSSTILTLPLHAFIIGRETGTGKRV